MNILALQVIYCLQHILFFLFFLFFFKQHFIDIKTIILSHTKTGLGEKKKKNRSGPEFASPQTEPML